jgi:sugar diacid utilization regulator
LDNLDVFAVEQASHIFAIELMGQERLLSNRYKYEGYLFEQLLQHQFDIFSEQQRSFLGLAKQNRLVCVRIQFPNQLALEKTNIENQYFTRLLYRELQKFTYRVLVLDRNRAFDLLVIIHDDCSENQVLTMLSVFFQQLQSKFAEVNGPSFFIGLGRVFQQLNEVQTSQRDAIRCIEYLQTNGKGETIYSYKQLGVYRLFLKHDRDELIEMVDDLLGPLLSYDQTNQTELVKTLKVYLESNQNMTATANQCFIHLNTVKYRLQTMKEILQKSHFEGKEMFAFQLAIYIYEFLGSSRTYSYVES